MVVMGQVWVLHEAQVHTFRSNLHIYHIKPDCPEKNEIMSLIHDFSRNGIIYLEYILISYELIIAYRNSL